MVRLATPAVVLAPVVSPSDARRMPVPTRLFLTAVAGGMVFAAATPALPEECVGLEVFSGWVIRRLELYRVQSGQTMPQNRLGVNQCGRIFFP